MSTGSDPLSEKIAEIKHLFMAFRNGITADVLRKAGMPYGVICGLQLPQINEIARSVGQNAPLARRLWQDRNVRESRLLACRVFPPDEIDFDEAREMARDTATREEADILAFSLLRRLGFAPRLADALAADEAPSAKYAGEALRRNLESM